MRSRRSRKQEAELDITSFMNLMIILVPVLLMTMVFSHTRVLDLTLPELGDAASETDPEDQILELIIEENQLVVNYPAGVEVKTLPRQSGKHNFAELADVLQEVKRRLQEKGIEKRDIVILSQPDTSYQTLVTAMDTARSFKAVVAAATVNAELFPDIAIGDAPAGPSEGE